MPSFDESCEIPALDSWQSIALPSVSQTVPTLYLSSLSDAYGQPPFKAATAQDFWADIILAVPKARLCADVCGRGTPAAKCPHPWCTLCQAPVSRSLRADAKVGSSRPGSRATPRGWQGDGILPSMSRSGRRPGTSSSSPYADIIGERDPQDVLPDPGQRLSGMKARAAFGLQRKLEAHWSGSDPAMSRRFNRTQMPTNVVLRDPIEGEELIAKAKAQCAAERKARLEALGARRSAYDKGKALASAEYSRRQHAHELKEQQSRSETIVEEDLQKALEEARAKEKLKSFKK
ncbi:unnamed protein product, partial [Polarella glacialis]